MCRTLVRGSFLTLTAIGLVEVINTPVSASMNDYKKKLEQVAEMKRFFQLPDALVLSQALLNPALSRPDWEYFLEKTNLIDKLAGRHLSEIGIYMSVDLAYYDYIKYLQDNNLPQQMLESVIAQEEMTKPLLIETIIHASKEVEK